MENKKYTLAIVGAAGLVGETLLKIISEEKLFEELDLTLFVSEKSAGSSVIFCGKTYRLLELNEKNASRHFDFAIFSAGDEVSKKWAEFFAGFGATVIDNSNAFRRNADVPLVVPEINGNEVLGRSKIIANPNCSTIQLAVVLSRLLSVSKIEKVVVSTYQSVSGAGKRALLDLKNKTNLQITEGIDNNIIAKIGEILPSGFSVEEDKIMFELNKILKSNISVCATAVRVPISHCHGESVYVKFEGKVKKEQICSAINCDEIVYGEDKIFLPTECEGKNTTSVFRLRMLSENESAFFVIADNLRRGAAYNAIEILKILLKNMNIR